MIYFIQPVAGGNIKIGTTTTLKARLVALQAECGPLHVLGVLPGSYERERKLHRYFAPFAVNGEWFSPAPEILEYIANATQPWNPSMEELCSISCRLSPQLRDVIAELAAQQRRSVAQMLLVLAEHGLKSLNRLPLGYDPIPFFPSLSPLPKQSEDA